MYILINILFFRCFAVFLFISYVKLTANKRGAPEAPPIHYPINFTTIKSKKMYKQAPKNI